MFGKDQNAAKEGLKGAMTKSDLRNLKLSLALKKKWQDPNYRKQAIRTINKINSKMTKEDYSKLGKHSRFNENIVEQRIKGQFDLMFKPYEVCDRIGVKAGRIFFIEIKSSHSKTLTEKQRTFKNIAGEQFLLFFQ
jgi:hypothetical protein